MRILDLQGAHRFRQDEQNHVLRKVGINRVIKDTQRGVQAWANQVEARRKLSMTCSIRVATGIKRIGIRTKVVHMDATAIVGIRRVNVHEDLAKLQMLKRTSRVATTKISTTSLVN